MKSQNKKIIIGVLSHLDPELYMRIALSGGIAEESVLQKLAGQMSQVSTDEEEDAISSLIADEAFFKSEIAKWAHILALIALYHRVEVIRGRMLNVASGTKKSYHRVLDFCRDLEAFGITHTSLSDHETIEELRHLVNNFKHHGTRAGKILSNKYSQYLFNSEIVIEFIQVYHFAEKVASYAKELSVKIIST